VQYFPNHGITKCTHSQSLPVLGSPVFTPLPTEPKVPSEPHQPLQRAAHAAARRFERAQVRILSPTPISDFSRSVVLVGAVLLGRSLRRGGGEVGRVTAVFRSAGGHGHVGVSVSRVRLSAQHVCFPRAFVVLEERSWELDGCSESDAPRMLQ